jgi:hypothetical protein
MSLDASVRRIAQRVMRKIGTEATIVRVTPGTYDVTTGTATDAEQDFEVVGRFDDYTDRELGFNAQTQTGQPIRAGDRKFTCAAADVAFEPAISDKVIVGDLEYDVVNVRREMAQHLPALYVLQLRR